MTVLYQEGRGGACDQLEIPDKLVVMISFDVFSCRRHINYHDKARSRPYISSYRMADYRHRKIEIFNTTRLEVCVLEEDIPESAGTKSCFRLLFTYLSVSQLPLRLKNGLYNCSVAYYWKIQQHLDCNMLVECEDGRDEGGHCPYSSLVCPGWVFARHKCYKLFYFASGITGFRAKDKCQAFDSELASAKTRLEKDIVSKLLRNPSLSLLNGLACHSVSKPFMYRWFLMWSDKTVIYSTDYTPYWEYSCYRDLGKTRNFVEYATFVCEKGTEQKDVSQPVEFLLYSESSFSFHLTRQTLVTCPEGHATHAFLSCDPKSRCGQTECYFSTRTREISSPISASRHSVHTVTMFSCTSSDTEVSYSLLCDFRQDCEDNSDESFCYQPPCAELSCTNGQCVPMDKYCNNRLDCLDGSDEGDCPWRFLYNKTDDSDQNHSYLIDLDGSGFFRQHVHDIKQPCPGTHYRCTKEQFNCLPIYTRCNSFYDCIFQEDERHCEGWTCPGLYRCRGSIVCVHADHMCDGWSQCPEHDDEWLCDMTCPAECLCQGHAFLCRQPFSAHLFPQLRYLDARTSGMTPSDLMNNTRIIRLHIAHCSITILPYMEFPNLLFLDLSYNKVTSIRMNVFSKMQNLRVLILEWNPVISVTSETSNPLKNLREINLSGTSMNAHLIKLLSTTPGVQIINVSFSSIQSTHPLEFQMVPRLKVLDIRATKTSAFPANAFQGLNHIKTIYTSYYRLCCKEVLPKVIPQPKCLAPDHYLSSCEDMIQSETYRLSLGFVAVLGSLGNAVCFACHRIKSVIQLPYSAPVAVFLASLQCADFSMGMYACVIIAAHEKFRGQYFHFEDMWIDSVGCKVAGLLSLLSSEASTLLTFLLTLEHLLLLYCANNTYRFSKRSAVVACVVTWFVGILLASLPLWPRFSHWRHYGQAALCSLPFHDRRDNRQQFLFIDAILIFNVCTCIMVIVTQIIIYKATPRYRILIEKKNAAYASVDLVMKVAVLNTACWISVSAGRLITLIGEAGPEVNVFMAVMVLPLNSAVNPLLYFWNVMAFRQRQKQEERVLNILRSRGRS